jgi:NTP pyrophosphatase (non-canonical NTP hydrolase)
MIIKNFISMRRSLMESLSTKDIQDYLSNKYNDKGTPESLFMKLVEEIGEVAEALNQANGRKNGVDTSLEKELADVFTLHNCYC